MADNKNSFVLKNKLGLPILFWLAGACYLVPFLAYGINFFGVGISDDTSVWGQFGDFFGGIINPTIGLITIWFLAANLSQAEKSHKSQMTHAERVSDFEICIALISYYEKSGYEFLSVASDKKRNFELMLQNRLSTLGDTEEDFDLLEKIKVVERETKEEIDDTHKKAQRFLDLSDELKVILGRQHSFLKSKYSIPNS